MIERGEAVRKDVIAERRQVTALFYDLVGSTELAARLDPEDLRDLQHDFHRACAAVVERYGGQVDRYMGDGAVVFFGFPHAHEEDPERAVTAGLDIVEACRRVKHPCLGADRVAVRVGIATGVVIAGEHAVPYHGTDADVVGVTPNLAARLQAAAQADWVVISEETHSLVAGLFECEPMTPLPLKGFALPQACWRVTGKRPGVARFEARGGGRRRPTMVSRQEELERLVRRWKLAGEGQGQVVLISGEPGIGKSRLIDALRAQIAGQDVATIFYQCSPYHGEVPLHPVISHLERSLLRDGPIPSAAEGLNRLEALLAEFSRDPAEAAALLAGLLPLPADRGTPPSLSAEAVRRGQLECLAGQLDGLSARRPVLVIFEDVHWIDPSSEELLDMMVERARRLKAMIVVTFRPGYAARWIGQAHVTLVALTRLAEEHAAEVVRAVAGSGLPPDTIRQIVARADGVPLFLEELTSAVLDVGGDRSGQDGPAIPATLADSLTARLDQLGDAKDVALVASAIGRSFSTELVAKAANRPAAEVRRGLARLVDAGLATARSGSDGEFVFRHALIQEAAYRMMLRSRRRAVHRQIAEALQAQGEGRPAAPEILAHHHAAAGNAETAILLLNEAARTAASRSANREAARLLDRALRLVGSVSDEGRRAELELELLISLGPILITTSGAGSAEVQTAYRRATKLCAAVPPSASHFAAHWGWWLTAPDFTEMRRRADTLSDLAARLEDAQLRLQAHHCQWATLFNLGQLEACLEHAERGLALYADDDHAAHGVVYGGHDPKVCALGQSSLALWLQGAHEASIAAGRAAVAHAEKLRHAGSMGHALDFELMLLRYRGESAQVLAKAVAVVRFAADQSFRDLAARARIFQGWASVMQGDPVGIRAIELGLAAQGEIGTEEDFPVYYEMLAEALGVLGRPAEGLAWTDKAITLAEKSGLRFWLAEIYRRKGELLLQAARPEEAVAQFHAACAIAKEQAAGALVQRAQASLTRVAGAAPPAAEAPAPAAALTRWRA